jgi:hypothetical protein
MYVFSNMLPIEEVPYCEPNLRRSQLLSGLSFLSLKPTDMLPASATAVLRPTKENANKLTPAQDYWYVDVLSCSDED